MAATIAAKSSSEITHRRARRRTYAGRLDSVSMICLGNFLRNL